MRWYTLMLVALAPIAVNTQVRLDTREITAALDNIRAERLRAHIRFLSDDLLEGRGTGTRGHEIAARYVAAEFEAIGLEAPLGRYLHPVRIRGAQVDSARTTLELQRRDGAVTELQYETDFIVAPDLLQKESSVDAEVVFAGYCVVAPEFRYDDFKDADLKGKLAGCLRGAPPSFPKSVQSRFSSFEPKIRALAARGAAGMVDLRPRESEETFPWPALVRGFRGPWMDWLDDNGDPARNKEAIRSTIVPSAGALTELFANAPTSFLEAIAQTNRGTLRPFEIGVRLRLRRMMTHTELESPNVIGLLTGSDPVLRHEYVVYTAHVDHLGVGAPVNGDSIYNGASDNASGTAALIEIARAFASMPQRPRRSILFVGVTGEEAGVVGSHFFVHSPPVPLKQIVANINVDGIAALHPSLADVVAIGGDDSTLGTAVRLAAERVGLKLSPDPAPERLYDLIGDQYAFIKAGIPAVWTISGDKSRDPAIDVAAFKKRWSSAIYHTPADDMAQNWNWTSATVFTRVQFLIGYVVGNSTARPSWTAGQTQRPPPSEREAMYNRYLEFASYVKGGSITPHWMADGSSFWYAEGTPSNTVIWKVDPKTNIKTAFSASDSAAARERERARPRIVGRGFNGDILEVLSPDGRWFAGTKDHNLWLRPADGGTSLQLAEDGVADYAWDVEEAVWSADSTRIVAMKIDGRGVAKIPLVDWLGVTEKVESVQPHRPTSGGPLRRTELHVFDISSRQGVRIGTGPEDQYIYTAGWRRDGSELMVLQMSRNFKRLNLLATDPATGSIRVVLTDTQKTFLWGNIFNYRGWREQGGLFTMLDDGRRFIWMSERDGWSHLYLYDFQGRRLRQLTRGSWPVQRLVAVDEKRGWVYFTAHGDPKRPYDTQVYRAGLERETVEPLTSASGRHNPVFSPSREFFLDSHSSLDRPPAVDLRRADGTLLQTLTRADIAGLKTLRWAPPEEFTAKAADGSTDLYGVIHKPFDFNPKRKYPVLEFIYAGPQTTHVPRTFDGSAFALTQLGFIVVMLDARGTPERGKEFQDVVYGNLGRHEIPDHVAALKQIAKRRPYMDMKRVGVIGRSYGGYFTIRAMLLAPDLYRVGVASASAVEVYGHSSRVEPYLGLPSENPDAYEYASNLRLAGNLEGKLLMIHGTADINAPFSQTMKMTDALIRANKPFDLLVLPGVGHFPAGEAERYWDEAVRRYLEEHLKPELTVHRRSIR